MEADVVTGEITGVVVVVVGQGVVVLAVAETMGVVVEETFCVGHGPHPLPP